MKEIIQRSLVNSYFKLPQTAITGMFGFEGTTVKKSKAKKLQFTVATALTHRWLLFLLRHCPQTKRRKLAAGDYRKYNKTFRKYQHTNSTNSNFRNHSEGGGAPTKSGLSSVLAGIKQRNKHVQGSYATVYLKSNFETIYCTGLHLCQQTH